MNRNRLGASLVAVAVVLACVAIPGTSAQAASSDNCAPAGRSGTPNVWAQRLLGAEEAWPFSRGDGERVAVLDSGVDAGQPYLGGHVTSGFNAVTGQGSADSDCAGSGTQVAGAIAAQQLSTNGISGVAPGVTIVPVRVTGQPGHDDNGVVPPAVLARGINWAVNHHIDVIVVSVAILPDDARVRTAVATAIADGITVVAAVGDRGSSPDGNPTPYPAAYPGVIGVSAIDATGARWTSAGRGSFVDLVAPGAGVAAVQRDHGWVLVSGSTALAAGYVAGVAALVRDRWRSLAAPRIDARLLGTAVPSADGQPYGHGLVNAYAAVTDEMVYAAPAEPGTFRPATPSKAELTRQATRDRSRRLAITLTIFGLGVLIIVMLAAIGLPRARRRGWVPTYAAPLPTRTEPDEPGAPALLFDEVTRR